MSKIFAIGDIHGMFDKFTEAMTTISPLVKAGDRIIFLGDYVDRGPQSMQVVFHVRRMCMEHPTMYSALMGNHEEMMFHQESFWIDNGGDKTLASYGDDKVMMKEHMAWMKTLPIFIETENHFFVHGGVNPHMPLDHQDRDTMLWIRSWQRNDPDMGKHIVYGHTPFNSPRLLVNSTGLDTGACFGGKLSIGIFNSEVKSGPLQVIQI